MILWRDVRPAALAVAPTVTALLTLGAGVMLLASGATPGDPERLRWLADHAPLPVIEVSHFVSSIVGLMLVLVAFGLKQRLDAAWATAVSLLGLAATLALLKGVNWEETAVLAALAIVVNGAEYALSARALGGRVTLRDATRVSVLSTAANLLPVPGAAVVKTRALQRRGARLRIAATLTIAIGVIWVGVAALLAGILVAFTGHDGVFAVVLTSIGIVVSIVGVVMLVTQKTQISNGLLTGTAFAIEFASVGLTSLRFFLVLRAIGFGGSLAQSATLAATAIIASAAGVFPSGLGLRELLSSAVGPAVGLSAAVSTVVAAIERVVSLAVVAVMALVIMLIDRGDTPVPESQLDPAPRPEGARCA